MKALLFNAVLALTWALLNKQEGWTAFVVGWLIGFALLALAQRVLASEDYVRRTLALGRFGGAFLWEFLVANLSVARVILTSPRRRLHPDYVRYDLRDLRAPEILLLGFYTSLTPGTTVVRVDRDRHEMILHALDARHPDQVCAWLDDKLRRRILAFTR
jgi:multisubunit Na+/H+ antiporter MnhE subunit